MAEAEVLYSDVKFTRERGNTDVATPSTDEPTYAEVKIPKTQRPAELPGSKQPAASNRRSGVTSERVALLVLSVLLAAAVTAFGVTLYKYTQITKNLQKLQDEAERLSGKLCGTEPPKVEQTSKPPSVRDETCPGCEDGWEPHGEKCYFFSSVRSSWNQSRTQCKSMRGDLVVIDSREEQEFLQKTVRGKMDFPDDKFWIGLTDVKNESEWIWVDNTPLDESLTFWDNIEPDNWSVENPDGEDCVRMGDIHEGDDLDIWADKACELPQKSICEEADEVCPWKPVGSD